MLDAWRELGASGRALTLVVLLGAVLLYAMNALLAATVAPSAVRDFGGIAYITWPTAAFLASSIAAASAGGLLTSRIGARRAFILAALVFCLGALACALAAGMAQLVAGRFVQGAGGGLLSSLTYILVRTQFPPDLWPRVFALISGTWGVAVLLGPLIGGAFANSGSWRGAFFFVAAAAGLLAGVASRSLERDGPRNPSQAAAFPILRLGLLGFSIAAMCAAQVLHVTALVTPLIALSVAAVVVMLRLDRASASPLFPSDAFSTRTVVGSGLWMALLLSTANDPFPLYGPLFLQMLHGLSPLSAGYLVALEALAWTVAAVTVAGYSSRHASVLLVVGPMMMSAGLAGIALVMPDGTVPQLILPIFCAGTGIGTCWAFMAQRVMNAAKPGESDVAASSVATVQLFGLAFGGAVAGLIANIAGFSKGLTLQATHTAAFWVPASFVVVTMAASAAGSRLVIAGR
jgi:MFS family permease